MINHWLVLQQQHYSTTIVLEIVLLRSSTLRKSNNGNGKSPIHWWFIPLKPLSIGIFPASHVWLPEVKSINTIYIYRSSYIIPLLSHLIWYMLWPEVFFDVFGAQEHPFLRPLQPLRFTRRPCWPGADEKCAAGYFGRHVASHEGAGGTALGERISKNNYLGRYIENTVEK